MNAKRHEQSKQLESRERVQRYRAPVSVYRIARAAIPRYARKTGATVQQRERAVTRVSTAAFDALLRIDSSLGTSTSDDLRYSHEVASAARIVARAVLGLVKEEFLSVWADVARDNA